MRRYSVNLVEPGRFPHFPWDGFSELWFDSEAALQASLESPEGRTLLADRVDYLPVDNQILDGGKKYVSTSSFPNEAPL